MNLKNNFPFLLPIVGLGIYMTYSIISAHKKHYNEYNADEIIRSFANIPDELRTSLLYMIDFAKKHHPDSPDFSVFAKNICKARSFFLQKLESYFAFSDLRNVTKKKIFWLTNPSVKHDFLKMFRKLRDSSCDKLELFGNSISTEELVAVFARCNSQEWAPCNEKKALDKDYIRKKVQFADDVPCKQQTQSLQKLHYLDIENAKYIKIGSTPLRKGYTYRNIMSFINNSAVVFVNYIKSQVAAGVISDKCKIIIGADCQIKYVLTQSIKKHLSFAGIKNNVICRMDEYDGGSIEPIKMSSFFNQVYLQLENPVEKDSLAIATRRS
ncbi:MAG: hypothetical protein HON55_02340 [Legionellales bacterium]|jgi:hypothetical protein|nr:hypothetical protein [Legionellales bacterium]